MEPTAKRLVLHHATGRLKGLYQILGVAPSAEDYPPSLAYSDDGRKRQKANHWRTRTRYIEYREWAQATANDFNPAQV